MSVENHHRRFRWRIIAACILMIFGGMLSAASSLQILTVLFSTGTTGESLRQTAGAAAMCLAGICWFAAGRLILGGRWKWMLLLIIIGYALGVAGSQQTASSRSPQVDTP